MQLNELLAEVEAAFACELGEPEVQHEGHPYFAVMAEGDTAESSLTLCAEHFRTIASQMPAGSKLYWRNPRRITCESQYEASPERRFWLTRARVAVPGFDFAAMGWPAS